MEIKELFIDGNEINCIDLELFKNLKNLSFINMARNKLNYIDTTVFLNLNKLNHVIISQNPLNTLNTNLFYFKNIPINNI